MCSNSSSFPEFSPLLVLPKLQQPSYIVEGDGNEASEQRAEAAQREKEEVERQREEAQAANPKPSRPKSRSLSLKSAATMAQHKLAREQAMSERKPSESYDKFKELYNAAAFSR